jgi:hypothetical protein
MEKRNSYTSVITVDVESSEEIIVDDNVVEVEVSVVVVV